MNELTSPSETGRHRVSARQRRRRAPSLMDQIEQFEQRVADALNKMQPGRLGALALHEEIDLAIYSSHGGTEKNLEAKSRSHFRSNVIDEALKKTTEAHVEALGRAGVPRSVLDLLQSWVQVTVDARVLQRQIELQRATGSPRANHEAEVAKTASPTADPTEPLSAAALGQALGGLGDETVRQRERAGELFSILRAGRKRGRQYPAFQAWKGMAGEPLAKVLAALGPVSSTVAYGFFTSPTDLLGGLTPIETTLGRMTSARDLDPDAHGLLDAAPDVRLGAVVKAAEACAAMHASAAHEAAQHDKWFRAEVAEAIKEADDPATVWVSNEEAKSSWAKQRAKLLKRSERGGA